MREGGILAAIPLTLMPMAGRVDALLSNRKTP